MGDLDKKRIVLGVSGGIAAYKACEVARRLGDAGAAVDVVMTAAAQRFVTAVTFQALTGRMVHDDAWDARIANNMPHIELTRGADALLIVPASADFLAKLAHGLCDDLLSTMAVARPRACPLLVVPAMNVEMWDHPATRRNVEQLRADGAGVLGPARGSQACGESGEGRMIEPGEIVAEVIAAFQPKLMRGRHVLITAGPTFEPIDPVRGLTNLSSGKMGYAIARAAYEAGARVTLVSGPTALAAPYGVERRDVQTAAQMLEQVLGAAAAADVFIGVAAVADWRVATPAAVKLKKEAGVAPPALQLALNPDILAAVAALPEPPYCVGFAAESERLIAYARAKRVAKKIPLIVANRVDEALGADRSELVLIDAEQAITLPQDGKLPQARRLIGEIARRLR
jgi:phosphopantothenoylcysteine decarboxylase / phosphopantothenate---cysteine ligase